MSVPAEGTNAPLNRRTKEARKRLEELTAKYVAEGMSKEDAEARAREDMRDNGRGDWRAG